MQTKPSNGVDLAALGAVIEKFSSEPSSAAFEFRSSTTWKNGAVVESTFTGHRQDGVDSTRERPHQLGGDEPLELLGTNQHVGPSGHLLHAASHCLTVTTAYHGAARGVQLDGLRVEARGTLDLQGFLGLSDRVRPGFKHIHLDVHIDSPNSSEEVEALLRYTSGRSPICTTLQQPVELHWELQPEAGDPSPDTDDVRHGVDFKALSETIAAIQASPALAKCNFLTRTEWQGGAQMRSEQPGFDQGEGEGLMKHRDPSPKGYLGDEPTVLLGNDAGPSPAETLLHAMANCVSVTTSYHAAARGIRLDALGVELDGDMDLQGFADLDDRVSPGYTKIRARLRAKAGGDEASLREFLAFAADHSPMCDSVRAPVHMTFALHHRQTA
jgi:uncharacterized OsmC-like protein